MKLLNKCVLFRSDLIVKQLKFAINSPFVIHICLKAAAVLGVE